MKENVGHKGMIRKIIDLRKTAVLAKDLLREDLENPQPRQTAVVVVLALVVKMLDPVDAVVESYLMNSLAYSVAIHPLMQRPLDVQIVQEEQCVLLHLETYLFRARPLPPETAEQIVKQDTV